MVIRLIIPVVLALSLLHAAQVAKADFLKDFLLIRQLAQDIFFQYLSHARQGSARPFIVGIDGPPGSGKSTVITMLRTELARLMGLQRLRRTIGVFGVDAFLRPRSERTELFASEHGQVGVSGNCNGMEYRWRELESAVRAISRREPYCIRAYDRSNGELQEETIEYHTGDIIIVEGTHVLGERLLSYIHYPIFLDIEDELMGWSRRERDEKRGATRVLATLRAVFSQLQLVLWRQRHARRAWVWLRWEPVQSLDVLDENNFDSPPASLDRELRLVRGGGGIRLVGVMHQTSASESLSEEVGMRVRGMPSAAQRQALSEDQYNYRLAAILRNSSLNLLSLVHGNDCLFQALGAVLGEGFSSREKVLDLLIRLSQKMHEGLLSDAQKRILQWLADSIGAEIEHLANGQLGGLPTVIYAWASLLGDTAIPPAEPLLMLVNSGAQIEIWQFDIDGAISQLDAAPQGAPLLIFDGFGTWQAAVPPDMPTLVHVDSQTDSGFHEIGSGSPPGSGPASLTQTFFGHSAGEECDVSDDDDGGVEPLSMRILRTQIGEASLF